MINTNEVFTRVYNAIKAYNANANVSAERLYRTSVFPTVEVVETDRTPVADEINLGTTNIRSTFDVQAYSDKTSGAMAECTALINVCTTAFKAMGYRQTMEQPTENTKEVTIKRRIARYTRVLASNDTLPAATNTNEVTE